MLPSNLKILGTFPVDYVLDNFVVDGVGAKEDSNYVNTDEGSFQVYVNSQRYVLFKEKGCTCCNCGVTAEKAYLCSDSNSSERAHFNFIVEIDGEEFFLTKDHIKAKSTGGSDSQDNYYPMCERCNNLKGHYTTDHFKYYYSLIQEAEEMGIKSFVYHFEGKTYICQKLNSKKNKKERWVKPEVIHVFKNNETIHN